MAQPVPAKRLWKRWKAQTAFHFPTAPATRYIHLWGTDSKGKLRERETERRDWGQKLGILNCFPCSMTAIFAQRLEKVKLADFTLAGHPHLLRLGSGASSTRLANAPPELRVGVRGVGLGWRRGRIRSTCSDFPLPESLIETHEMCSPLRIAVENCF